ncbi:MAG: hypothetical protein J2P43_05555 [Candidatus Dormibacteraeota bacterium]|nr:hypothetical protein [Candidatus Dormibacteraeota bacterium]
MSQDPNRPLTTHWDRSGAPEADRPAPGPQTAGDPAGTFPRDDAMEGQAGRQPEPGMATGQEGGAPQAVDPGLADQAPGGPAERPAWGQGAGHGSDGPPDGPGWRQDAERAPGEHAGRPGWGQGAASGAASTAARDEPQAETAGAPGGMCAAGAGAAPMADRGATGQQPGGTVEEAPLERFRERWPAVQGAFVDDPKAAVAEADRLVAEVIQEVEQRLTRRRQQIQGQWTDGESDTERLRQFIHGYRALFHRLLENEL